MNFPPADISTMGLLNTSDIARGLKMMGFDLPEKKVNGSYIFPFVTSESLTTLSLLLASLVTSQLNLVLTVLGLHRALSNGRCIPLSQLKTAVLDKKLEDYYEAQQYTQRGGGGKLHSKYKQRAQTNLGDPGNDKMNEIDMMKKLEDADKRRREEKVRRSESRRTSS